MEDDKGDNRAESSGPTNDEDKVEETENDEDEGRTEADESEEKTGELLEAAEKEKESEDDKDNDRVENEELKEGNEDNDLEKDNTKENENDDPEKDDVKKDEDNAEEKEIPVENEEEQHEGENTANEVAKEDGKIVDNDEETEESPDGNNEETAEMIGTNNEEYRLIFDKKAVDGRLDLKGFKTIFRLLGEVVSSEEAEQMFADGDKDNDNTIDFDEFCRLYVKFSQKEEDRKEAIRSSFDKLFPGSEGEVVELRKVELLLMKLQRPDLDLRLVREKSDLDEKDIKQLVRMMDADGSGYISKQEFVDMLCQHVEI